MMDKTVTPDRKERIVARQYMAPEETPEGLLGATLNLASQASGFVAGRA